MVSKIQRSDVGERIEEKLPTDETSQANKKHNIVFDPRGSLPIQLLLQ